MNCHLTDMEKVQLAVAYLELPLDSRGRRIGVAKLCKKAKVCSTYVTDSGILSLLKGGKPLDKPGARKQRCDAGVPRKFTAEVMALVEQKARSWGWEWSYDDMVTELESYGIMISRSTIAGHTVQGDWQQTRARVLPLLNDGHREDRLAYAWEHLEDDWYEQAELDEKWVYGVHTHSVLKLPPGEPVPIQPVQSKRHLPKVLVLSCLMRPRFDADGNCIQSGKLVCERVGDPAGPRAWKKTFNDKTMDSKRYKKMVIDTVFPAIVEAFKDTGVKEVTLQQDGARAHTKKKPSTGEEPLTKELNAIGAKLTPRIRVRTQPAQSPDVNICDLAFFRALACALRKRRRVAAGVSRSVLFDLDKLAADAQAAFEAYDEETLDQMWAYKTLIMQRIIDADGWNNYERHRTAEERAQEKGRKRGRGA
jgi:hypothetical protein